MANIILLIILGIFGWLALQKVQSSTPSERKKLLRQWLLIGLALAAVLLAMTGRLHWVGAAIALAVAGVGQLLRVFGRYLPWIAPLLLKRTQTKQQEQQNNQNSAPNPPQTSALTPEEAQRILNVSKNANRDEIVGAHRKLIQKFHPDQGGNDYLATRINAAKELLLKELQPK